ncbi:hypothetical protein D3C85_1143150 [compost metagenome]
MLAGNLQVEPGAAQHFARQDMHPGGQHGVGGDIVEDVVPGTLVGEDGDAAVLFFRHHEAVAAVELLDVGRIDAEAILEAQQEGDGLLPVGDGVEVPVQVGLAFQLSPAGVGERGGFGAHGSCKRTADGSTTQKTCQGIQALEWGSRPFSGQLIARCQSQTAEKRQSPAGVAPLIG